MLYRSIKAYDLAASIRVRFCYRAVGARDSSTTLLKKRRNKRRGRRDVEEVQPRYGSTSTR
jgi:hypothetical protein